MYCRTLIKHTNLTTLSASPSIQRAEPDKNENVYPRQPQLNSLENAPEDAVSDFLKNVLTLRCHVSI